jgi:hypothetical protein
MKGVIGLVAMVAFAFACGGPDEYLDEAPSGQAVELGSIGQEVSVKKIGTLHWGTVDTPGVNLGKSCTEAQIPSCSYAASTASVPGTSMDVRVQLDASWNTAQPGLKALAESAIDFFCGQLTNAVNGGSPAPAQAWSCARVTSGANVVMVADHSVGQATNSTTTLGSLLSNSNCAPSYLDSSGTFIGLHRCNIRRVKLFDYKFFDLSADNGWTNQQSVNAMYHIAGNLILQAIGIGRQTIQTGYVSHTTLSTSVPILLRPVEKCAAKSLDWDNALEVFYTVSGTCS